LIGQLVGAVCGALAALIAYAIVRNPKENRVAYIVVLLFAFGFLYALSKPVVRYIQIESELQSVAAFQELKRNDPEAYERIKATLHDAIQNGESLDMAAVRARSILSELVATKYLPRASDDAIANYVAVMVEEIEQFTNADPNACYQYLFPKQYGPANLRYVDKKTMEKDLTALAQVIHTAAQNQQSTVTSADGEAILKGVVQDLYGVYGDDILLLDKIHDPSTDRKRACTVVAALYRRILDLPKPQRGVVLRHMFFNP